MQVIPGNLELLFNFTSFKSRFFMSGLGAAPAPGGAEPAESSPARPPSLTSSILSGTNLYSSWDAGCVHFVGICEDNFNSAYIGDQQLEWLTKDLEAAAARRDAGAARRRALGLDAPTVCSAAEPTFIVAYMHRPLYCTTVHSSNCQGSGATYLASRAEGLFKQHGVDLVFAGHLHDMERTHPVYAGVVDPTGPVYVVNGAGGNREGVSTNFITPTPAWSAMQGGVAGVGTLTVANASTLIWEFYRQNNGTTEVTLTDQVALHACNRSESALAQDDADALLVGDADDDDEISCGNQRHAYTDLSRILNLQLQLPVNFRRAGRAVFVLFRFQNSQKRHLFPLYTYVHFHISFRYRCSCCNCACLRFRLSRASRARFASALAVVRVVGRGNEKNVSRICMSDEFEARGQGYQMRASS